MSNNIPTTQGMFPVLNSVTHSNNDFNLDQLQAVIGGRLVNSGQTLTNVNCIAPDHPGDRTSRAAWWNLYNGHIYGHCGSHHCDWKSQDAAARELLGLPRKNYNIQRSQASVAARYTSPHGTEHVDEMRFDWFPGDPPCWYTIDYQTPNARPCDQTNAHKHVWHSPAGVDTTGWPALVWEPQLHPLHSDVTTEEMADEINDAGWMIVAEGAKAAKAIAQAGLTAISVLGGKEAFARFNFETVKGRQVAIWPDHDQGWRKIADACAHAINFYQPSTLLIVPPNGESGSKDDAADLDSPTIVSTVHNTINRPFRLDRTIKQTQPSIQGPDHRPALLATGEIDYEAHRNDTWRAIIDGNFRLATNDYHVYRRDNRVLMTQPDGDGRLEVHVVEEAHMRYIVAQHVFWYTNSKQNGIRPHHPNNNIVKDLPKNPHHDLPELRRVTSVPFLTAKRDALAINSGYYDTEKTILDCPFPIQTMDLATAVAIIDDLIADFPFQSPADRANCFAAAIMPLLSVRAPITPLALFGKPAPRTGATLLAETLSIITTGQTATKMQLSRDSDELAKEIASGLQNGSGVMLWDNLSGHIDSSTWAQYLTGETFGKRKLRYDDIHYHLPRAGTVNYATANNLSLSKELIRRSFSIRLNARVAEPGNRGGFKYTNLYRHVRDNRPHILSALCSIVQHWIDANCPEVRGPSVMGGFEEWRDITASVLGHAGIHGFLENTPVFLNASELRDEQWTKFMDLWWNAHHDSEVTTAQLFEIAEPRDGKKMLTLLGNSQTGRVKSLAHELAKEQDVVHTLSCKMDVTITRMPKRRGYSYWRLTHIAQPIQAN